MNQTVILVDKDDKFLGYASRVECHIGRGKRHRAFVTLLFDSQNRVILQKRKHRLFDSLWDLTAISHPLHVNNHDESYQEASDRALAKEMGIEHVAVDKMGSFNYFARDGKSCENEHCAVLIGNYDGKYKPNQNEVYEAKKINFDEFLADISKKPKNYTPWAILAARELKGYQSNLFKKELEQFLGVFEPYAKRYFDKRIRETAKYPKLISQLYKDLFDFTSGGKKLRPFLVWIGYKANGGRDIQRILPIALAFEIINSYFLIHDDVIDKSELRRKKLTIHKRYEKIGGADYGKNMAIILGDIACSEALDLISKAKIENVTKLKVIEEITKVLLNTIYGEVLDVEYSRIEATFEDIKQVNILKTAIYSVVEPLKVGGLMAELSRSQVQAIEKFGISLGLAYQLRDDILGLFGEEKVLGKPVTSDMREGKNTLLILKAKGFVKGVDDKKYLEQVWGSEKAGLKELLKVRKIVKKSGSLEWAMEEIDKLIGEAKEYVQGISNISEARQILNQMADFVGNRQS